MPELRHRSCRRSRQSVHAAARRIVLILFASILPVSAANPPAARVGLPTTLTDVYIPGGEARPKPRPNREPPLVVRLLATRPALDGKRYDFEVYGLEAGHYNLADFLEAVDPADPPRFPEIPLRITTALPPGLPEPAKLPSNTPPKVGGYTLALWILGALWLAGLLALIFWKRRRPETQPETLQPPSLADRLRALVTAASRGALDDAGKATLERLILGHWRQRLPELADIPPSEALVSLRRHAQAGPLLRQLEQWLHAPESKVDAEHVDELLSPYRE